MRESLKRGEAVIGSWINSASPVVAELMAASGFDFLTVDAEHSAVDVPQVQQLLQAVRSGSPVCAPLVRVPACDYGTIKRYMDAGARGIVCPLVNTPEEARELVAAVRYPPAGRRGVGFCRDNLYGIQIAERLRSANDDSVVCVQIEHIDAVERVDAILGVEGVDAAFIGPYDLTASMGIAAQFDHPDYLAATDRILAACRAGGVAAGIHVVQPDVGAARDALAAGYRMVAYSLDITMLTTECARGVRALKS